MSFCCFPMLACLKPKSRVQSDNKTVESKRIEKSFSYDQLKTLKPRSRNVSLTENRSLGQINQSLDQSRASHKSTIAVRCVDRFQVIKSEIKEKKFELPSLDVSKISNISVSDQSCVGIANEIVFDKETCLRNGVKNSGRNKRRNLNLIKFINAKKKEAPPMFLKNPCFASGNSTMHRSDSNY